MCGKVVELLGHPGSRHDRCPLRGATTCLRSTGVPGQVLAEVLSITVGGGEQLIDIKDQRSAKKYEHAIKQLLRANLLEEMSEGVYEVSYEGYLAADEILALGPDAVSR